MLCDEMCVQKMLLLLLALLLRLFGLVRWVRRKKEREK